MSTDNSADKIKISRMMRGDGGQPKPNPTPLPTPEPVTPTNGQQFPPYPRTVNLVWKAVSGATDYVVTVQFYSNTPQGKTWLTKPPVMTTSTSLIFNFPSNVPGRWNVRAEDSTSKHTPSPDSQWSTFDFTVQILEKPTLISPLEGQIFSNYPRKTALVWTPVAGATGYVVTVDACQDRQATSKSIWQNVLKTIVQTTSFTFNFVGAQPGRWNVFAIDNTNGHQQSDPTAWNNFSYTV
jgi:hypothetical protein